MGNVSSKQQVRAWSSWKNANNAHYSNGINRKNRLLLKNG
jgi:hypothetical protein